MPERTLFFIADGWLDGRQGYCRRFGCGHCCCSRGEIGEIFRKNNPAAQALTGLQRVVEMAFRAFHSGIDRTVP